MAIFNTQTQEFDWSSYGVARTGAGGIQYTDFISDQAHESFEDDGGGGVDSNAYNNWRNINRVLAPQYNTYGGAIVGTVGKNSEGESYLSSVSNGNFQSDGLYYERPTHRVMDDANTTRWSRVDWRDNSSYTTTYQSRDPNGIPVGKFIPLMRFDVGYDPGVYSMRQPNGWEGGNNHFDQLTSIDNAYDILASTGTESEQQWCGPHVWGKYTATTATANTIASKKYVGGVSNRLAGTGGAIGGYGSRQYVLWYAHDGVGNGMMVITQDVAAMNTGQRFFGHSQYGNYNAHFESTRSDDSDSDGTYFAQGGTNSGQVIHKFPSLYTDLDIYGSSALLSKIAEDSQAMGTRWLMNPLDPSKSLIHQGSSDGSSWDEARIATGAPNDASYFQSMKKYIQYKRTNYGSVSYPTEILEYNSGNPHIVMFPTKMGSASDAALKTPQNLYFWSGQHLNAGSWTNNTWTAARNFGQYDIKFGDMVRTGCNLFTEGFYPGTFQASLYTGSRARHNVTAGLADSSDGAMNILAPFIHVGTPTYIASLEGNVTIDRITRGTQEPVIGPADNRYIQFAGLSTSYNALAGTDYSVDAGTLINNNNAWTNPEYLMDGDGNTGAICTKTGFANHLAVRLSGNPEGASVAGDEPIRQLVINVGGVRKLVLGPQILKIAVYGNDNGVLGDLIAGPITMASSGSDQDLATRQIVFDDTDMVTTPTFAALQNSWIAFWVESPE